MQTKLLTRIFYLIGFTTGLYIHLPLMTVFLLNQGVDASMIVLAGLFWSLGQVLFEVPTGYLADRFGQKLSMISGFFIEGLGLFVIVLWPSAAGLAISYFVGGIAAAFLSGSEEALCYENTKASGNDHVKIYGRFMSANTIGMVVATAIGGAIYGYVGLGVAPWLFAATGSMLILSALLTGFLKDIHVTRASKVQGSAYMDSVKAGWKFIKEEDFLRTTLVVSMFILSGEWVLYNIYQPIFSDLQVPIVWFGLVLSLGMVLNSLVTANVHRFERKLKLQQILASVSLFIALAYLLLATTEFWIVGVIAVILILGFAEVYRPVLSDYVNERIPSEQRSTILSTISLSQRISAITMRLALTAAVLFGSFAVSAVVQGVYLVVGAVLTYWLLTRCGCAHRIKSRSPELIGEVR
jgi:MFS family permease